MRSIVAGESERWTGIKNVSETDDDYDRLSHLI